MQNLNNPRPLPPNLTDQKILQELNLPVGTPIEQTTQESLQPRVIETEYGNFIPCKPEDVPSEKRAELLASLQPDETTNNALPSNDSIPPQIQTNENALPHQNTDEEDPSAPQTNSFVLNQTNDDVMPYFSISTGSPYGIPLDDPPRVTISTNYFSIPYLEVYVDDVKIESVYDDTPGFTWIVDLYTLTKGIHTLRVVGYSTEDPADPAVEIYTTESTFEAFKIFTPHSDYTYQLATDLTGPYDEVYTTISQAGTHLYRLLNITDTSKVNEMVLIAYDMNDNEVGRSYYNNYIRVGSYYGAQELKVKLTPGRYKLVFKSKSSSFYITLKDGVRLEDYPPTFSDPYNTSVSCQIDNPDLYWALTSDNSYDLSFYLNDTFIERTLSPEDYWFYFQPTKLGDFTLKFEARNSCDMSIPGAVSDSWTVSVSVYSNDSLETIKTRLQNTYTDAQAFYNIFIQEHTFGTQNGAYLLSAKEDLAAKLTSVQTLLANTAATKTQFFNMEVDLANAKNKLFHSNLDITQAGFSYYDSCAVSCYGRTSINTKVYLRLYNENFQLVDKFYLTTGQDGFFTLPKIKTILPDIFYNILRVKGGIDIRVYHAVFKDFCL